ncbi:hypothetical protein O2N63_15565 [Aliiroseovarius sp. KMU-50]|uniref:Uncharacterized protein n=1 Tax=Aliiroseovarius salicola TaxID=3009082 RepID=A0ABT4W6I7_9RHOB|nr:hypothetical protein [Aliiroseovarius sp. KMU-50]MDA5095507.1 hypothetical protein [Aliiroseovarius sp. KMU-50]
MHMLGWALALGLSILLWWYPVLVRPARRALIGRSPYPLWAALLAQLTLFGLFFTTFFGADGGLEFFVVFFAPPVFLAAFPNWLASIWVEFPYLRPALMSGIASGTTFFLLTNLLVSNWRRHALLPALIVATSVAYPVANRTVQTLMAQEAERLSVTCFEAQSLLTSIRDGWPYELHAYAFVDGTPYYWSYAAVRFLPLPQDKQFLAGQCND